MAFEGADAPPGAVGSRDGRDKHACAAEAVLADGAADGDEEAASAVHWSRSQLPRPGPPPAHALWTASVRSAVAVAPLLLVTLREQASNAEGSPKLECDAGTARLAWRLAWRLTDEGLPRAAPERDGVEPRRRGQRARLEPRAGPKPSARRLPARSGRARQHLAGQVAVHFVPRRGASVAVGGPPGVARRARRVHRARVEKHQPGAQQRDGRRAGAGVSAWVGAGVKAGGRGRARRAQHEPGGAEHPDQAQGDGRGGGGLGRVGGAVEDGPGAAVRRGQGELDGCRQLAVRVSESGRDEAGEVLARGGAGSGSGVGERGAPGGGGDEGERRERWGCGVECG